MLHKALALTLSATALTLVGATSSARAATPPPPQVPSTILFGTEGYVTYVDGASFETSGFSAETSQFSAVEPSGLGFYVGGVTGDQDHSYVYLASGLGALYPFQVDGCRDPQRITPSPDGKKLALGCTSTGGATDALEIVDATTGVLLHGYRPSQLGAESTVEETVWSVDGASLWVAGSGGLAGINASSGAISAPVGTASSNIRLLPGGSVVSIGAPTAGGQPAAVQIATPASTGVLGTPVRHPISADTYASTSSIATDPSGHRLWFFASSGDLRSVDLSSFTTTDAGSLDSGPNAVFLGLAMDPTGQTLYVTEGVRGLATSSLMESYDMRDPSTPSLITYAIGQTIPPGDPSVAHPPAPYNVDFTTGNTGGKDFTFTARALTYAGSHQHFLWHWDDGTPDTSTDSATQTHTFATTGQKNVTVSVTDDLGQGLAPTGVWDGRHWFTRGWDQAQKTHKVYVYPDSHMTLSASYATIPVGGSLDLNAVFTYTSGSPNFHAHQVDYTMIAPGKASEDLGTEDLVQGGASPQTLAPLTVPTNKLLTSGTYTFFASYDAQDSGLVDTQSNEVDVVVSFIDSAVGATTDKAEYASGAPVQVTTGIVSGCGGGTYDVAVDGVVTRSFAQTDPGNPAPFALTGLKDGTHTVKVVWTPGAGDPNCLTSVSPTRTFKLGTSPTTTTLTAASTSRPGVVPVTVKVASPGGVPTSGTVALTVDGEAAGTVPISADGVLKLTPTIAGYGPHTIGAAFSHTGVGWTGSTATAASVLVDDVPGAVTIKGTAPKPGRLQVQVVPADAHGTPVTGYTVGCTSAKGPAGTASGPGPVIEVPGLLNNVDYLCSARATNAVGAGPVGPTAKGRPGKLPTTTLKPNHAKVAKNSKISLDGTVTAANQAQVGRTVTLTFRVDKSKKRTVLKTTRTDKKGHFHFSVKIAKSGAYQASTTIGPAVAQDKEVFVTVKSRYHRYA